MYIEHPGVPTEPAPAKASAVALDSKTFGHDGVTATPAMVLIQQGDTTPVVQLLSGKPFKVFRPCPHDIVMEEIAHSLGNQCRFNGHCIEYYSTAQHSAFVAALLADEHPQMQLEALFHDGDETLGLPDLITPVKSTMNGFRYRQKQIGRAVAIRFGLPEVESREVKQADLIALETEGGIT